MKVLSVVFFINIALALASNIIVADDDNFDDIVLNSGKTSFVKFFAEWCSHCKKMQPAWEDLAKSYEDVDDVQIVEINADKNRVVGKRYNVASFPTLKLFRADSVSEPIQYDGVRDVSSLANFLVNEVGLKGKKVGKPSKIVQLHDGNIEKLIENKERAAMVLFTNDKNCDECISYKNEFDLLSHAFHKELEKVIVAEVQKNGDEPTDWIRSLYGITEFPSIIFINADLNASENYTDNANVSELVRFLNKKLGTRRAVNGLLDTAAGIIPEMDEKLKKFVGINIVDRRDYVQTFIDALKKVDDASFKEEIKYYAVLVNQFLSGQNEYVNKELDKFNSKVADKAVEAGTKDIVQMKINLLNHINSFITEESYRSPEDVLAERETEEPETADKFVKDEL